MAFLKVLGIFLRFLRKKNNGLIWTSRSQDMGLTPNNIWVVGQIQTSFLLLRFELKNNNIES